MFSSLFVDVSIAALFGLLIGSFLNVVIYRLPKIMEQQWDADCTQHLASKNGNLAADIVAPTLQLSLCKPRSHCIKCSHKLGWYENIPVFSWLILRGKCRKCKTRISIRYPLIELATAGLFGWCIYNWGATPTGWAWCGFSAALLSLAFIDWDTTYLPDSLTLPLLWAGLLVSTLGWSDIALSSAVWGATAGYVSLWSIYWIFKLLTGKEGMGYGDFKLFAALGAWFGWQALIPIILVSSCIGAIIGIIMKLHSNLREGGYIPFGPFLAGAGFASMFFGHDQIITKLFSVVGL